MSLMGKGLSSQNEEFNIAAELSTLLPSVSDIYNVCIVSFMIFLLFRQF